MLQHRKRYSPEFKEQAVELVRIGKPVAEVAERLAAERGYIKGGVSKLLEELVREESENPRLDVEDPSPGYAALMRKSQEISDGIRKLRGKSK